MHQLVKASIDLAYSHGYIDRLQRDVYKIPDLTPRKLSSHSITEIVQAFENKDSEKLLQTLLKLDKFPVDDVYLGVLRHGGKEFIDSNPHVVKRITDWLFSMRQEELIALCRQPVVSNRRMGESFHKWFKRLGFPEVPKETFWNLEDFSDVDGKNHNVILLKGSRKEYKKFANEYLDCGVEKELDLLLKVNGQYIIGEAKYVSSFGGNQTGSIKEALDFINSQQGDATRIAVLDGVVWLDTQNKMSKWIRRTESIAMSALLLLNFIENLANPVS